MKTVFQALMDEIYYPIPKGFVENRLIDRALNGDNEFTVEVAKSREYKGALADCLCSLIQTIQFSEADKNISSLSDSNKERILQRANRLYREIGEDDKIVEDVETKKPKVFFGSAVWQ